MFTNYLNNKIKNKKYSILKPKYGCVILKDDI